MKLKTIILIGFLITISFLNAQTDFRSGYIIQKSGDTLYGQIDYRGDLFMSTICKFKNEINEINKYSPNEILEYRLTDSKYYVSKEINHNKVFLEYLFKGEINIYYMRDKDGDHYFLDKENYPLKEIPYEEKIIYVDNQEVFYKSKTHIGVLNLFFDDAPSLKSKIQSIKKPDHKPLIQLAKDYHYIVNKKNSYKTFEKKESFFNVNLEMVSGVINYDNIDGLNDKFYFQKGIIAHFWMPRTNEKFYFKTGFLHSTIEKNGKKEQSLTIPIHMGYMAPSTYKIRPFASFSLTSPTYSVGFATKINKRIKIGVQSWLDFNSKNIRWVPSELYSYSILGSLFIDL